MKVTVNGMVVEGTPQEVTTFLQLNKLLPYQQAEKTELAGMSQSAMNMLLYREIGKKKYQSSIL